MTLRLGLSDSAIEERRAGIGGSDARIVVHGTPEERYELWQIKVGEKKSRKIMSDWAYALRYATETLQLDWYEHEHPGTQVVFRGQIRISAKYPFMRCTLDGLVCQGTTPMPHGGIPINCKHVSRWTKEARDWCIEHYTPQITHEALVLEAPYGLLSLLHGEKEPEIIRIDVDPWYAAQLIETESAFWQACVEGVPPKDCLALDTPKTATPQPRLRSIDLNRDDPNWKTDFIEAAKVFISTEPAFRKHQIVRDQIKQIVPADVGSVSWGEFLVKRSRSDALTMTFKPKEEDNAGPEKL